MAGILSESESSGHGVIGDDTLQSEPPPPTRQRRAAPKAKKEPKQPRLLQYNTNMPAVKLVQWVEAAMFLKAQKDIESATEAFARVLTETEDEAFQLLTKTPKACREILRTARVRIDVVAMLYFRAMWAKLDLSQVSIHIWIDGSPQWRGLEMFSASMDLFVGDRVERRLLPCIALKSSQMDSLNKCVALLYGIWLLVGPSAEALRAFTSRVVSICSDSGVERGVVDMEDLVGDLLWLISGKVQPQPLPGAQLFPLAIRAQGWKHVLDGAIKNSLETIPWFAVFLERVKAVNTYLRDYNRNEAMVKNLKSRGLHGLAGMVESVKLVNFATWRWSTLEYVLEGLAPMMQSFLIFFDPEPFRKTRGPTKLAAVCAACSDGEWMRKFNFTLWLTQWLGALLRWGGGCACHPGSSEPCDRKGRNLPRAHTEGLAKLRVGLSEANAWVEATYGGGQLFLDQVQGCARKAFAIAVQKLDHLDKLPFLLARLGEPGVRGRVLYQYSEAPPERHHRLTNDFLAEGSSLRAAVDAMDSEGGGMSPELAYRVKVLGDVPLDDSVAEGPHARMARLQIHSRRATWAWHASTMRLRQNLTDIKRFRGEGYEELQFLWDRWSTVLRPPTNDRRASLRALRRSRKAIENSLYHLDYNVIIEDAPTGAQVLPIEAPLAIEDGVIPEDENEDEAGRDACEEEALGVAPESPAPAGEDAGDAIVAVPAAHRLAVHHQELRLMRDYASACLEDFAFYTLGTGDIDEDAAFAPYIAFQVIRRSTRAILVPTFADEAKGGVHLSVGAQVLEVWTPPPQDPLSGAQRLEFYVVGETEVLDIIDLCRGDRAQLQKFLRWDAEESDVQGCRSLVRPRVASPQLSLGDVHMPALGLAMVLEQRGWTAVQRRVVHFPGAEEKEYDGRQLAAKAPYLQCLVALDQLWSRGLTHLPSALPQAPYRHAIGCDSLANFDWAATDHKEKLLTLKGKAITLQALKVQQMPTAVPLVDAPPAALPSGVLGESEEEPDPAASEPLLALEGPVVDPAATPPAASSSSDSSSDSSSESDTEDQPAEPPAPAAPAEEVLVGELEAPAWAPPARIFGMPVTRLRSKNGDTLLVRCHVHADCKKTRMVSMWADEFGPDACVAYLRTWQSKADSHTAAAHAELFPKKEDVREFLSAARGSAD